MPKDINEYRLVRARFYPAGTHARDMNGLYVMAKSMKEAKLSRPDFEFARGHLWKSWDKAGLPIPIKRPW